MTTPVPIKNSKSSYLFDQGCSPLSPIINRPKDTNNFDPKLSFKLIAEKDRELEKLKAELVEANKKLSAYTNRLESAVKELATLETVHAAEIKAAKHITHVKELVRVAKDREYFIERDRMVIELNHLRYFSYIVSQYICLYGANLRNNLLC